MHNLGIAITLEALYTERKTVWMTRALWFQELAKALRRHNKAKRHG